MKNPPLTKNEKRKVNRRVLLIELMLGIGKVIYETLKANGKI